jgi:membrane protease subunit HflK
MNLNIRAFTMAILPGRLRGMFNLNDPRWGRGDDNGSDGSQKPEEPAKNTPNRGQGPNQGPPDLDELWRDFNRKLGGLFGGNKNNSRGNGSSGGGC